MRRGGCPDFGTIKSAALGGGREGAGVPAFSGHEGDSFPSDPRDGDTVRLIPCCKSLNSFLLEITPILGPRTVYSGYVSRRLCPPAPCLCAEASLQVPEGLSPSAQVTSRLPLTPSSAPRGGHSHRTLCSSQAGARTLSWKGQGSNPASSVSCCATLGSW